MSKEIEEYRINRLINDVDFPDEIIHSLRDDECRTQAITKMLEIDKGLLIDLFANGDDYNEVFEVFIKNVGGFREFYRSELQELIQEWINENK